MKTNRTEITAQLLQGMYAEIAKSITSSLDISTIVTAIMTQVQLFFKPNNWSLFRIDEASNELYFAVAKGLAENKIKDLRFKIGEGIVGYVAQVGKSVLVRNVNDSNLFNNNVDKTTGFETKSIIAVPIVYQSRVLGVIEIINTLEQSEFSENDLDILQTIADFSAIAFNNAIIHEQMIFMANHDTLTALYNRAFLNRYISLCTDTANYSYQNVQYTTAVLIDVDHFKEINDQYGHTAGDKVLVRLAALLKSCCRKSDYVIRIGGDEFLILFPNLDSTQIKKIESDVKSKIEAVLQKISHDFSFSFGIASGKSCNIDQIIQLADKNMYQIKNANRTNTNIR